MILIHWGRGKMATISQMIFSQSFSCINARAHLQLIVLNRVLMHEHICSSLCLIQKSVYLKDHSAKRCQFMILWPICMVSLMDMYVHGLFLPSIYFHYHYQFVIYNFSQKWRSLISWTISTTCSYIDGDAFRDSRIIEHDCRSCYNIAFIVWLKWS